MEYYPCTHQGAPSEPAQAHPGDGAFRLPLNEESNVKGEEDKRLLGEWLLDVMKVRPEVLNQVIQNCYREGIDTVQDLQELGETDQKKLLVAPQPNLEQWFLQEARIQSRFVAQFLQICESQSLTSVGQLFAMSADERKTIFRALGVGPAQKIEKELRRHDQPGGTGKDEIEGWAWPIAASQASRAHAPPATVSKAAVQVAVPKSSVSVLSTKDTEQRRSPRRSRSRSTSRPDLGIEELSFSKPGGVAWRARRDHQRLVQGQLLLRTKCGQVATR